MTVKNVSQFHNYSNEQLQALTTRHLTEILESTRGRIICSCGKGNHCGDEALTAEEIQFNQQQAQLYKKVKEVLSTRETLVSTKQVKKKEKKVMAY